MTKREHPRAKLERVSAERQRIVDNALATLPPPAAGLTRVMWFGESDIAKPVDVPEAVAEQIAAISAFYGLNKGPICGVPTRGHFKAMGEMHRLMRPYIETQYPTPQLQRGTMDDDESRELLHLYRLKFGRDPSPPPTLFGLPTPVAIILIILTAIAALAGLAAS